jgi:hypothetical protein
MWKNTALFYDAQYVRNLQRIRKPTLNSKQNTLGRYFNQGAPENDMLRSDNISTVVWCLEIIQ